MPTPLFQESNIGPLVLANRFVRSATWMAMATDDGEVTDPLCEVHRELAAGGLGLIITGFAYVSREGQGPEKQLGIYSDDQILGLKKLASVVHSENGKVVIQIVHCGNKSDPQNNTGLDILGPSDIFDENGQQIARALTTQEIARITDDFADAAIRAKSAGFDGVQLHFAHGYLGSQFLSPAMNQRDDQYGGSLENRCRFLLEVLNKVRVAVGDDYPIMAKLNVADFFDGGLTAEDGVQAAKLLAENGLNAVEVSGGMRESGELGPARRRIKKENDEAYFLENAIAVREAAKIPIMLVGGLRTPAMMKKIHLSTGIEYFSLCRPLLHEPDIVNQWQAGRQERAACSSCSGCFLTLKEGNGIYCIRRRDRIKK